MEEQQTDDAIDTLDKNQKANKTVKFKSMP